MIQSRQLEAFRAVMLTGAMTAAAEMMHVTQPAVSRLVRDLEAELGLVLFQRRGNLVVPTAQADSLLLEVERSFVGLQSIRDFAEDLREGRGGSLRLAALPAMSAGFMPRFVAQFSQSRPRLRIMVDGLPSPAVRDGVANGRFDVGVSLAPFQRTALTAIALEDNAVVVLPAHHRLVERKTIHAADLADENLILLTKFNQGRHPVELALQAVRRGQVIETPQSTIACILVSEGAGVAIVDPFSASEFVGRGVVLRPFDPALVIGTAIVHSSERGLSIVAQEFLTAFVEHTRRFLTEAEYLRD